jgi:DNA-binding transcriptional regulator GbsR (MarR family)
MSTDNSTGNLANSISNFSQNELIIRNWKSGKKKPVFTAGAEEIKHFSI